MLFIYLTTILLTTSIWSTNGEDGLIVKEISEFPHLFHSIFRVFLVPSRPLFTNLVNNILDTVVFRITDPDNKKELEITTLVYGGERFQNDGYMGKFVKKLSWQRSISKKHIIINITFDQSANNKSLEIYQISASSNDVHQTQLKNLTLAKKLYNSRIKLYAPQRMIISVKSLNGQRDQIFHNEMAMVSCQSQEGSLPVKPVFLNINDFNERNSSFLLEKNEITSYIFMTSSDHLSTLKCRAGEMEVRKIIIVNHGPSNVNISPNIGTSLEIGEPIQCIRGNGYPFPKTYWKFVKGPDKSSMFYKVLNEDRKLTFENNIPNESVWIFNCSSEKNIMNERIIFTRTIIFNIKGKYFNITERKEDNDENIKLKNYFNQQMIEINQKINNINDENKRIKSNNKNISSRIQDIFQQYKNEISLQKIINGKKENEVNNIKDKTNELDKRIVNLSTNMNRNISNLEIFLKNQNTMMNTELKEKIQNLSLTSLSNRILNEKLQNLHKLIILNKLNLDIEMKFVKANLYWLVPINWVVSSINIDNFLEKKHAISHPFYSIVKRYQMTIYMEVFKKIINFYLYLPNSARNHANGWPFKAYYTISVLHNSIEKKTISKSIYVEIQSQLLISGAISFDRNDLIEGGFIVDDKISIICNVVEA